MHWDKAPEYLPFTVIVFCESPQRLKLWFGICNIWNETTKQCSDIDKGMEPTVRLMYTSTPSWSPCRSWHSLEYPHSQLHVYYTAVHTTFNITQLRLLCPSLSQFTVTYVHSTDLKHNQG